MIIRLLPNQVPTLWPAIKFAAVQVDRVSESDLPIYLNRLLADLLSDKAQCFIRMDDDRKLQFVGITRLIQDVITGEKSLAISCLYSFETTPDDQWQLGKDAIVKFAKANGCKGISAYTSNKRVFDIVSSLGFTERFRCFYKEV